MIELYALKIRYIVKTIKAEGWAFIFTCVYLFFEYVRPQSIYPLIDVLPWVPLIIFLAFMTGFLGDEFGKRNFCLIDKLLIVYAIVVLLSSAMSTYPDISFSKLRTFFDWFIIYFLIVGIISKEERFFVFFLSFLLYSFKMSQHGFLSWARRGFAYSSWGVTGAPGWFHNSGEAGIQMCIFTPLAIAFIFAVYKFLSKPKLFFLLLMPLTSVGTVIATSSRGAVVGLGAVGFSSVTRKPKMLLFGSLFLLLVAGGVILVMPESFAKRFESMGEDRTSTHRLERWTHGLQAMNQFPIFGVGFQAWTEYYPQNFTMEDRGSLLVHNIFIQCGSELGYTGLAVFSAMILACFLTTKKVRKLAEHGDDKFLPVLSYGFDAALVGFLVSGSFVTVLYYPYFWIHCALTSCLYNVSIKKYVGNGSQAGGVKLSG